MQVEELEAEGGGPALDHAGWNRERAVGMGQVEPPVRKQAVRRLSLHLQAAI